MTTDTAATREHELDPAAPPPLRPAAPESEEPRRLADKAKARGRRRRAGSTPPGNSEDQRPSATTRLRRWWRRSWHQAFRGRAARRWARRLHLDRPFDDPMLTSTAQAAVLNPALAETRPQILGPMVGTDLMTTQPLSMSPQGLYMAGFVSSPNVAVFGAIGAAKSTLVKCLYVLRPIALGERVAVFDRKQQKQDGSFGGEYLRAAEAVGRERAGVLRFNSDPELGARINPLDPALAISGSDDNGVGQDELLLMLVEASLERRLTPKESWALARAHRRAVTKARETGRVAILEDVVEALYTPDAAAVPGLIDQDGQRHLSAIGIADHRSVTEWGLDIALELEKYIADGPYAGYFDGPTRGPGGEKLRLDPQLLVIDTSAVPGSSVILGIIMALTSSYLAARWAQMPGFKTLIVEEAYSSDKLGSVPAILRDTVKRSRGVGISVVSVFHHASDVARDSPMWSLMRECEIAHIFRQDKTDDAEELLDLYGLPGQLGRTIQLLPKGVHVVLRGARLPKTLLRQYRTTLEVWVTDTDDAMRHAVPTSGEEGDVATAVAQARIMAPESADGEQDNVS